MKYVLYIMITIFLENGDPFQHEFKISFDEEKKCVEMRKVFDVGVAFLRLSQKHTINYQGQCKKVVSAKAIRERSL